MVKEKLHWMELKLARKLLFKATTIAEKDLTQFY